jgi:RNA polymerase, sigma 70 subunit, rpoD subfamily
MSETAKTEQSAKLNSVVDTIISKIPQEREKEIISRRFGLYDRKETLELIGDMFGITRERVRQLEKAILTRLRAAVAEGELPSVIAMEKEITSSLSEMGRVARMQDLASHFLGKEATAIDRARVAFISELAENITIVTENDDYYQAAAIDTLGNEKQIRARVEEVVKTIKKHGEPVTAEELHKKLDYEHPSNIAALATVSKKLASLNDQWGLAKWPAVNPKNIRDKIYVVLDTNGSPMHFSDIAKGIRDSEFNRRSVTTQAIHNELIKDKRFVLIGRGIYALASWGYSRGTVSDIITDILKNSETPLHRDEIVRQVLDKRQVKETTILLNLQSKPQFKRVAKATYVFEEAA